MGMTFSYTPYAGSLAIGTVLAALLALYAWRKRSLPGGTYFFLLMVSVAIWCLTESFEMAAIELPAKVFFGALSYIGVATVAPFWFLFVQGYTQKRLSPRGTALLWSIPPLTLFLVFSNQWHGLVWPRIYPIADYPGALLVYEHGWGVFLHAAYSYVLILWGSILLIRHTIRSPRLYRMQSMDLVLAAAFPWVGNFLYFSKLLPFPGFDFTPFAFVLTGLMVALGIEKFQLFDLLPVAQDTLFDSIGDAVFVVDSRERLADANPAACEILGLSEATGKTAVEVLAPDLLACLRGDMASSMEVDLPERGWFDVRVFPLRDRLGRLVGRLVSLRDINKQKRAQEDLAEVNKRLAIASQAKSEFLANMSHEIRTPMNGILGMTDFLIESGLNPEQFDFASTVKNCADSLLVIVNDILDFSKVEAGKLILEELPFDPRQTLEAFHKVMAPRAHQKGLAYECQVDSAVPLVLRGDPGRLRQILNNLVGNAIKFTSAGEVSIRVEALEISENGTVLRFLVRDTGIGITPEVAAILFHPFIQADASTTRRFGGTGLGLAISKQLAKLMDGEIGVESGPGGSTFWFSVRLGRESQLGRAAANRLPSPSGRKLHILLAEDNAVNQMMAVRILNKLGHVVDVAANGKEALASLRRNPYDLVLMDIQMPEMDGIEATRRIRDGETVRPDIPVIALTAHAMKEDRERCLAAVMDDYVSKPIQREELLGAIARWADKI